MTTAGSLQHVNSVSKSMMMYGTDGAGGIAPRIKTTGYGILYDDLENFGDVGSLEDNVESFCLMMEGWKYIWLFETDSLTEIRRWSHVISVHVSICCLMELPLQ
ncbi:UNVERIFIED_CONTAM: Transcriptional corepressor LEUNIG [Sesamum radiatum]|uniref:Transcriptional corepressor LEUNIG n=1 Tax=Sesamum radiatum TaxID=300843 RepID=A0AAW2W956_SESRA